MWESRGTRLEIYVVFLSKTHMSCNARKQVFGVSHQVGHKPAYTATELDLMLEILDLGRRGIVLSV